MKLKVHCSMGTAGIQYDDEIEIEDGLSDDEIAEEVHEWAVQFFDEWYEVVE